MSAGASTLAAAERTIERYEADVAEYRLRYLGDPILETRAEHIASAADIPPGLVAAMKRIMHAKLHGRDGVGLAANQVGCALRVIIAPVDGVETVMVNPRIVDRSETMGWRNEGCLSIPSPVTVPPFEVSVKRHHWIDVEWEDEAFTTHFRRIGERLLAPGHTLSFASQDEMRAYTKRYVEMPGRHDEARCVQHEIDHLNGIQLVDHAERPRRRKAEKLVAEATGR